MLSCTKSDPSYPDWNPGSMWADTVNMESYSNSGLLPYQILGLHEGITERELRGRFGVPIQYSVTKLYNGRDEDDIALMESGYDIDCKENLRNKDAGVLYHYIRPSLADSIMKDKICTVYTIMWRLRSSPDSTPDEDKYLTVFFVGNRNDRRAVWGYTNKYDYLMME